MLDTLKHRIASEVGRIVGKPSGLLHTLRSMQPPTPPAYTTCASEASVIPWHLWAQQMVRDGILWRGAGPNADSERGSILSLANLCRSERSRREIDIRQIRAATSSKSHLEEYATLHHLATGTGRNVLDKFPAAPESIEHFMAWPEVRLGNPDSTDVVHDYRWCGAQGLVLVNGGGSHHLAAAIHLAHQFDVAHTILVTHITYELDAIQAQNLQKEVGLVYLPENPLDRERVEVAIEDFGSEYGILSLRGWPGHPETSILAIPLSKERSRRIYTAFLQAGWPTLNEQLEDSLVQSVRNNASRRAAPAIHDPQMGTRSTSTSEVWTAVSPGL